MHKHIQTYWEERCKHQTHGAPKHELAIRTPFLNLINAYASERGLLMVSEQTDPNSRKRPDGTLLNKMSISLGHWESKGPQVDLPKAIQEKRKASYPTYNILFENSQKAILYREGRQRFEEEISERNHENLDKLLREFVSYQPEDVRQFEQAIHKFREDIPAVIETLRQRIDAFRNPEYIKKRDALLAHFRSCINPKTQIEDIREMLIQHILTKDIFLNVFRDTDFHQENHLAKEVGLLEESLLSGTPRKEFLPTIGYYYDHLSAAAGRVEPRYKQPFLKHVYQNFYTAYNKLKADKLGIVYTPDEIVGFMARSADELLTEHFGKGIGDEQVHILDPATGTGTFICTLMERMEKKRLQACYNRTLYANEVSLLAYYIANLNIEYAYWEKMGEYLPFEGICFMDTLDNTDFRTGGKQKDLYAGITSENIRRATHQMQQQITLVIGNPPYNVGQNDANENNKNPEYRHTRSLISQNLIQHSKAQKTAMMDLYVHFYMWAMERIDQEGMVAFVTNRSFIDAASFDGFRRYVARNFDFAYVLDLGGDVRKKQPGGNVFGIMTGVAVMFLIKTKGKETGRRCDIRYADMTTGTREEKLQWLHAASWKTLDQVGLAAERIAPDTEHRWLNLSDTDFMTLLPLCDKETKYSQSTQNPAIFKLYSNGIKTHRDPWVYGFDKEKLIKKIKFFINTYNNDVERWQKSDKSIPVNDFVDRNIKFSRELENFLKRGVTLKYNEKHLMPSMYRPFVKKWTYFNELVTNMPLQHSKIFGFENEYENVCICFSDIHQVNPFSVLATKYLPDLSAIPIRVQCLPRYRYTEAGGRIDNITDEALKTFQHHYQDPSITRDHMFSYIYAVLHAPSYRAKYRIDLQRHFPRIALHKNFSALSQLGASLLHLHIHYENVEPATLTIRHTNKPPTLKCKLNKQTHSINIDEATMIDHLPPEVLNYTLGDKSALEWVLAQYKKDHSPGEQFPSQPFTERKEELLTLIAKLCTVSIDTIKIVEEINEEVKGEE